MRVQELRELLRKGLDELDAEEAQGGEGMGALQRKLEGLHEELKGMVDQAEACGKRAREMEVRGWLRAC
jgi:hypothetical protein